MSMNEDVILKRIVEYGEKMKKLPFVLDHQAANKLICDLDHYPHAFVIGCIVDRRIPAERAWSVPYYLSQRIGGFEFGSLRELSLDEVREHMNHPSKLHPLNRMSDFVYAAIQRIADKYQGDAGTIWGDHPSSARLVYRFLQFKGIGPKIATMAANILVRDFGVVVRDKYSLDISPDRHVRRVFRRLELVPEDEPVSADQIIYRARDLHPKYPGLLDLPAWQIGREWCKPKNPRCNECFMKGICPTAERLTT